MEQYLLGKESFWWPYIDLLPSPDKPEFLNTPMWYSEIDALWIRGTNLEQAVQDRERSWRAEYEEGLRQLLLEHDNFYPGMLQRAKEGYSWNLYKWAATIMSSRSFPASCLTYVSTESTKFVDTNIRDRYQTRNSSVLLPVFDLANHHPDVRVTWEWNTTDCRLMIDERLEAGAQVYNNYGPKSNEELVMGYGFSLENNLTDQYALKMARRVSSRNVGFENRPEVDIHYIRLPSHRLGDYPNGISALTAFPQKLLDDISLIVANDRERPAASQKSEEGGIKEWDNQITRNKVNVVCHLNMVIQKQTTGIVKWQEKLPESPQNEKQFHAARYRASQLHILNKVFDRLCDLLRDLSGQKSVGRDVQMVRLEYMLAESPPGFATDFRNALKIGLGTRQITKIRREGWADLVSTMWVCGLWVWNLGLDRDEKEELAEVAFNARIFRWLLFLRDTYWSSHLSRNKPQLDGRGGSTEAVDGDDSTIGGRGDPSSSNDGQASSSTELRMIAESYLGVVYAAAAGYPDSAFARPEWTVDFLAWGLKVVKDEGFMCPNLEGKEGDDAYDEYVLFMECGGDMAEDAVGALGQGSCGRYP
ncbi:hypothetical protein LPUS_09545 [Lasallia pustulata]|uniref:SET domain-containing protein n=1 Tax=Lasallia pustulata TaxID=136370 RepID=A0A1W5D7T5_9LECA|nr:hypothetical protein LPUS_09545 [Lasallia pustulata]